jgi:hypothetical protein
VALWGLPWNSGIPSSFYWRFSANKRLFFKCIQFREVAISSLKATGGSRIVRLVGPKSAALQLVADFSCALRPLGLFWSGRFSGMTWYSQQLGGQAGPVRLDAPIDLIRAADARSRVVRDLLDNETRRGAKRVRTTKP